MLTAFSRALLIRGIGWHRHTDNLNPVSATIVLAGSVSVFVYDTSHVGDVLRVGSLGCRVVNAVSPQRADGLVRELALICGKC